MTTRYITFVLNLDKRDSKGSPELTCYPTPCCLWTEDTVIVGHVIVENNVVIETWDTTFGPSDDHELNPRDYIRPLEVKPE